MKEKSILPTTYFMAAIVISLALHFVVPGVMIIHVPLNLVGIAFIAFGGVLNIWADQLFKKRSTTVKPYQKPSALVADGPFRWCRHPMYLGMVAILVGISIILGSVTGFVGPVAFWLIIRLRFIPVEERSMVDTFGDEYEHYKRRVRSWM
jgi:protein-S-isoprenylcysteine O-methyltransferase Ste14